jgi:hypothetical protein
MAKSENVYILGGAQSDFARNWNKEGKHFSAVMRETVNAGMQQARIEPSEIQTAHVGNFAAELYGKQGQLNAFFLEVDRRFRGRRRLPRHRGMVRTRVQGSCLSLPCTVRAPRRRIRPALRAQGRISGAHLVDQFFQRPAQPARADARLAAGRKRPAAGEKVRAANRGPHQGARLLAGDRRHGGAVPGLGEIRR